MPPPAPCQVVTPSPVPSGHPLPRARWPPPLRWPLLAGSIVLVLLHLVSCCMCAQVLVDFVKRRILLSADVFSTKPLWWAVHPVTFCCDFVSGNRIVYVARPLVVS